LRDWAEEDLAMHSTIARNYLAGLGQFPERAAVVILTGRYLAELADMTRRWADWASDVVEGWPEDLRAAEPDWASFAAVASLAGPPLHEAPPLSGSAAGDAQPG
jgi:hypothetical protein